MIAQKMSGKCPQKYPQNVRNCGYFADVLLRTLRILQVIENKKENIRNTSALLTATPRVRVFYPLRRRGGKTHTQHPARAVGEFEEWFAAQHKPRCHACGSRDLEGDGMSISCNCDYDGDFDWWWSPREDFEPLSTNRARRCCSCSDRIAPGDDCLVFNVSRRPKDEIEERIYGYDGEINMADKHMCEPCGGLLMAVSDLGLCWNIGDNIKTDVREWAEAQREYRSFKKD